MPHHDPVPICIECHRTMTCIKNGVIVCQQDDLGNPLHLQHSDLYECRTCGKKHASGFSTGYYDRNIHESFNEELERWNNQPDEFKIWWH